MTAPPRGRGVASALTAVALGVFAVRAVVLAVNALTSPSLGRVEATPGRRRVEATPERRRGRVVALVPARDEARRLPVSLPTLLVQGADRVVVLDDDSSDGTADVAAALGAEVAAGEPLPAGWTGKNWACHQLAALGTADTPDPDGPPDYLLFTDADVVWSPGALDELLALADRRDAALVTVFPRQLTVRGGERLVTPLIDAAVLGLVPTRLTAAPAPVVANGQVMLFRRDAYARVGGHEAVAGELVEDVRLAERVRDAGEPLVVCRGGRGIAVRMYDGYRSSLLGLAKSIPGLHGDRRSVMVAAWLTALICWTVPWLLPPTPAVRLARLCTIADRAVVAALTGRRDPASLAEGLLGPLSPLLVAPAYLRALGGPARWRGRSYP
ncbi:glycosyltransferase [Mycetocola reblochoni]|uniref:Glycosyl transferase, family 2 n=2 Tax=Mycetocola reblochoni TaxID=331618 RepID=A0A1R4I7C6_9MICO|nr:glycosyltransferase [Mycetocola reblochoni]RLP68919.1 glycosyltransferase [Mycetocola reblochoni]SJN15737.1 Glycosyl transferase, family 2 [Mycetocola reblochoni REB411]